METINIRIKRIRQKYDLTQAEFAKRLAISQNAIAYLEAGKRNPGEQTKSLICKEFLVNQEWLETGKGEMLVNKGTRTQALIARMLDDENSAAARLFEAFASLSEEQWDLLQQIIDDLSTKKT